MVLNLRRPRAYPRLAARWAFVVLVFATACLRPDADPPPASTSTVPPASPSALTPSPMPTSVISRPVGRPPDRDLVDLAYRLGDATSRDVPRVVSGGPVSLSVGRSDTFWVPDVVDGTTHTVSATIMLVSDNAYWYVDDSVDVTASELERAAEAYENVVRPAVTGAFGDIWSPGVDNDPRLTILNTPMRGADGIFGSQDEYLSATHPKSNQREMVYMDGVRERPGSEGYLGVLAHELQHAIQWNLDAGEDAWINEGLSEVAKELAGYSASFVHAYMANPGVQLNFWPDDLQASPAHYGGSTLFLDYLAQHYGGYPRLAELARDPADGIDGVERFLGDGGPGFREVFKDWVVANYLDADEGVYGYPSRRVSIRNPSVVHDYSEVSGTLPQLSAEYVELRLTEGDAVVSFEGQTDVPRFGAQCHSGRGCWWGNRGDSIDATLTRSFDLAGLEKATLTFWTWYDLEENWDYAYVEASTDGVKWVTLEGRETTDKDPVGNNFGHGFTGASGGWVEESVDLSAYVGGTALVRFEYVTDDAINLDGFVVDDLAVPELGFDDDMEASDDDWVDNGFLLVESSLPQAYLVQVIEVATDGSFDVRDLSLDDARQGQTLIEGFGVGLEYAVVVVAPFTPETYQPASWSLHIGEP